MEKFTRVLRVIFIVLLCLVIVTNITTMMISDYNNDEITGAIFFIGILLGLILLCSYLIKMQKAKNNIIPK
jgi:uncharacterized ion transporter superfamily protein YfcC